MLLWLALAPKGIVAAVCVTPLIVMASLIVVLNIAVWTCPACEKPLGREWTYNYCPNCGIELRDIDGKSM